MTKHKDEYPVELKFTYERTYDNKGVELSARAPGHSEDVMVKGFFDDNDETMIPLYVFGPLSLVISITLTILSLADPAAVNSDGVVVSWVFTAVFGLVLGGLWLQTRLGGRLDLRNRVLRAKRKMIKAYREKCANQVAVTEVIDEIDNIIHDHEQGGYDV